MLQFLIQKMCQIKIKILVLVVLCIKSATFYRTLRSIAINQVCCTLTLSHTWQYCFSTVLFFLLRWLKRNLALLLDQLRLVVAVINFDAYPFSGFLRPDLSPWGYKNRCFLVSLWCLIVRGPPRGFSISR